MASNNIHHKYEESDMKEIREVRYIALMAFKMQDKIKRLDTITKAILPDIKWDRIAPNIDLSNLEDSAPEVIELNAAIATFREEMTQKLEVIIHNKANYALELIQEAYEPHIHEAAITMAKKYHTRSKKSGKRHRSKPKQHKNNNIEAQPAPPENSPTTIISPASSPPRIRPSTSPMRPRIPPPTNTTATQTSSQTSPHRSKSTYSNSTQEGTKTSTRNPEPPALTVQQTSKATTQKPTTQATIKKSFKVKKRPSKAKH